MVHCAVLNCSNNSDKPCLVSNNLSFLSFPRDPETRKAWIYATGRLNWAPRPYSTICSDHFTEYDFTIKNGKKFLRSTTVPRFNLNEQNSRYTESQYHNETQAALEFLTGQMFPESQVPVQQDTEVVTVQVIGENNPNVVVKKPSIEPQDKPNPPEKKPKYFSIVNCFKSEAELKAEKEKIHELINDNLDPSISQILLSLNDKPVKKKKKKNGETNPQQKNNNMPPKPRGKNGQILKVSKPSVKGTGTSSDVHYTDNLTREELIHKLKQRDERISQQQITIRKLQNSHLRDQVEIESLRIKLNLKNNETVEEPTNEPVVQMPVFKPPYVTYEKQARQRIVKKKRKKMDNPKTENNYQSNRDFSDQDQAYIGTERHIDVRLKKPARQQIVTPKRQRLQAPNPENHQSNKNFSDQNQAYCETQNKHSGVGLNGPAGKKIVKQNQEIIVPQNRHSGIELKRPAGQKIIVQNQEIIEPQNTENRNQSNMIFSNQDKSHFWNF